MRLPERVELKTSDANYLYLHDIKEFFGGKGWDRYVYMNRLHAIINLIERQLPTNSSVIDVGCAQGNFSLNLAKAGFEVCGVDMRSSFIAYAKLKTTKEEKQRVSWLVVNAKNLPFLSGSVNCILLLEILEHTTMPEQMVEEACRSLRNGGYLVVSTPNQRRVRITSRCISYSDFRRNISKTRKCESSAKGSEHVLEFHEVELLTLLRRFNLKILDTEGVTFLGFRFIARLFDFKILSNLEKKIFKVSFLKEKFGLGIMVFCKKL